MAQSNGTSVAEDEHSTVDLVESIINDSRSIVGAHLEVLRDDVRAQVSALGEAVRSSLVAVSLIIVTALLAGIAMAESLVALGLPSWAAFWIVALAVAALGAGLVQLARRKARTTGKAAAQTAERVKDEIAWISNEAPKQKALTHNPQHE